MSMGIDIPFDETRILVPDLDADCLVENVDTIVHNALTYCMGQSRVTDVLTGSPQVLTFVAPSDGRYALSVMGGLILDHLDYHVHLQVNGAAPAIESTLAGFFSAPSDGGIVCSHVL